MRNVVFSVLTIVILSSINVAGQIKTTKVAPDISQNVVSSSYDSTQNFLGSDVMKYKGQELYLKGLGLTNAYGRKEGYKSFFLDYKKKKFQEKSNVYKCCSESSLEEEKRYKTLEASYTSNYSKLSEKYFKVLEIVKHPKAEENEVFYFSTCYLKLQEKESGDTVYFEYSKISDLSFPFITVGYFEKQKQMLVGKEFIFTDDLVNNLTDIQTGKAITVKTGQKWKCTDLTFEEKWYKLSYVIENPRGEKSMIEYDNLFGKFKTGSFYTISEAEKYSKKFGRENFNTILQGRVSIGMTREMCKLSWGEPNDINETITAGKKNRTMGLFRSLLVFRQWYLDDNSIKKSEK